MSDLSLIMEARGLSGGVGSRAWQEASRTQGLLTVFPLNSHSFSPSSAQYCRPISTQSITSTDSGDSEENYVPMVSPLGTPGAHLALPHFPAR